MTPRRCQLALRAPEEALLPARVVPAVARALAEVGLLATGGFEKRWEPHGLSHCAWGADFRLVIHTWPEHGLATIDLWLSSKRSEAVVGALELALGWRRAEEQEISAGNPGRARTAPCGDS